jgi:hypothetical protein
MKEFWNNTKSIFYTLITIILIIVALAGSVVLLPFILIILGGFVVFFMYKIGSYDPEEDDDYPRKRN